MTQVPAVWVKVIKLPLLPPVVQIFVVVELKVTGSCEDAMAELETSSGYCDGLARLF